MYARVPFAAGISLLWTCILSAMRGGDISHGEDMAGGAITGATLVMLEEGFSSLFTSPIELARDKTHVMITATGHDKPGWVALLSRAVANANGNVTHSKMVRLGEEFIIQMHVAVEPHEHKQMIKELNANKSLKGLGISATTISRRKTGSYDTPVMGVRVKCVGADK
jgi:predicted amino acid-binding ACT domain protein